MSELQADLEAADPRDREGFYGLVMDLCGLAAIGLFVTAAAIWCGGLAG